MTKKQFIKNVETLLRNARELAYCRMKKRNPKVSNVSVTYMNFGIFEFRGCDVLGNFLEETRITVEELVNEDIVGLE